MDIGAQRIGGEVLLPLARREFGDTAVRMVADPLQNIDEVGVRIYSVVNRYASDCAALGTIDEETDRSDHQQRRQIHFYPLGFEDPAYFTRFFQKRSGPSPKAFRIRSS